MGVYAVLGVLTVRKANVIIVVVVGWLGCVLAPVVGIGCGSGDDGIGCGSGDVVGCIGNRMVGREWVYCARSRREGNGKLV